jgi:hypothetical protein
VSLWGPAGVAQQRENRLSPLPEGWPMPRRGRLFWKTRGAIPVVGGSLWHMTSTSLCSSRILPAACAGRLEDFRLMIVPQAKLNGKCGWLECSSVMETSPNESGTTIGLYEVPQLLE